ncbi:hypothetical protein VIGAN_06068300 [Vigna angularis var. angularis]|uniref:CCHC-type domain-containing protein n=1 Tax=Vigna angularis var. angularis TaxID=157739 RepID=A0A0S3SA10_PHAAN|nr:hypothetical protein VIGAN_06068300 [Vigna angularis var. angularis]
MAGHQTQVYAEGASINRPPLFTGDNYAFWKVRMEIFMGSVDRGIWEAVLNGPYIPKRTIDGVEVEKPYFNWTPEENRRAQFDIKARNIISSAVVLDEFYRISVCKTAQEMWEVLRVTHEGTEDVKRARKNTLIQEYEMFRMQPGETISDVQKRFIHIVNHLTGLGKTFDTDELNVKFLKSLDRSWQPKVTAISESQNLTQMSMPILFGKLREHELELRRLTAEEDQGKRKTLAFKSEISKGKNSKRIEDDDSDDDEENMSLMIKKFAKFMKAKGKDKYREERKENHGSSSSIKCYGCGERGHVKTDCPKNKKSEEKKERKFPKKKKAYIAWEENASSSSSSSVSDEEANLCLMADLEDAGSQVSDSSLESSNEFDLQKAFLDLLNESEKLDVAHKKLKKEHNELKLRYEKVLDDEVVLRNKVSNLETKLSESDTIVQPIECLSCKSHLFDIDILENLLAKATKSKSYAKTNLEKSNARSGNTHLHKKSKVIRTRRIWVEKGTFVKNKVYEACCFYCMKLGHTSNKCSIKHFGVPNGKYAWVKTVK